MSAVLERTRLLVWARAEDRCEHCGMHLYRNSSWHSLQHRLARKMGGSRQLWINSAVNLALVCGSATTPNMCHEELESNRQRDKNVAEGWVLSMGTDPRRVPMLLWDGRTVFLTSDGRYEIFPEVAA